MVKIEQYFMSSITDSIEITHSIIHQFGIENPLSLGIEDPFLNFTANDDSDFLITITSSSTGETEKSEEFLFSTRDLIEFCNLKDSIISITVNPKIINDEINKPIIKPNYFLITVAYEE